MTTPALPRRRDNLLGICHAIGRDLGFDPLILRVTLALALLASAQWALVAYGVLGLAAIAGHVVAGAPRAVSRAPAVRERVAA